MAIKVNNTTVINDSRALTNIASVDATTATAIGNAGVGGATALISEGSISSAVSYIDFTFSGSYENYILILSSFNNGGNNGSFGFRWLDSSNNPVTTYSYNGYTWAETNNMYYGKSNVYCTFIKPRDSGVKTIAYDFSPELNASPTSNPNYQIWIDSNNRQCNGVRFFSDLYSSFNLNEGKYQLLGMN